MNNVHFRLYGFSVSIMRFFKMRSFTFITLKEKKVLSAKAEKRSKLMPRKILMLQ